MPARRGASPWSAAARPPSKRPARSGRARRKPKSRWSRAAGAATVWAGGLRAGPLARAAGLATDPRGRIFTDPQLRSISHPHIFAVGDAAHPIAPTGAPYRMSVLAALTSGAYAAEAILDAQGPQGHRPFSFSTFG